MNEFNNITFDEETHTYQYNNKRADVSVTSLIHQYSQEFDEEATAERMANKRGVSVEVILDEWRNKRDYSCVKGNEIHKFAQGLWKGEEYNTDYTTIETRFVEQLRADLEVLKPQAIAFYNDYADMLELVKDEQYIYDEDYDCAGSIDLLCKNKYTNEFVIVDFKSNDNFDKKAYSDMKVPLHELADNNLSHYSLQLEIYKQIFEKNTAKKVECTFIVHFDLTKDNYTIIEPLNVKKEVKKILEMRRRNRMGRLILIMGEGGSGKTSSLRNIPCDEHIYVDCDKKGLNYKGWKNDYNAEKRNYFPINDSDLVVKLLKKASEEKPSVKYITIDTINSIMIAKEMRETKNKGYEKWSELAVGIYGIIECIPDLRDDLTVILVGHSQTDEDGFTRLLTNGRKLEKIGIEKYFNTVLLAKCIDGKYLLETRANNSTARTPFGAFEELTIDNDIMKVIEVLKEY